MTRNKQDTDHDHEPETGHLTEIEEGHIARELEALNARMTAREMAAAAAAVDW